MLSAPRSAFTAADRATFGFAAGVVVGARGAGTNGAGGGAAAATGAGTEVAAAAVPKLKPDAAGAAGAGAAGAGAAAAPNLKVPKASAGAGDDDEGAGVAAGAGAGAAAPPPPNVKRPPAGRDRNDPRSGLASPNHTATYRGSFSAVRMPMFADEYSLNFATIFKIYANCKRFRRSKRNVCRMFNVVFLSN